MWDKIIKFIAPPVFEDNEEKTRMAVLLNIILVVLFLTTFVGSAGMLVVEPAEWIFNLAFGVVLCVIIGWLWWNVRQGRTQIVGTLLSFVLWISITVLVYFSGTGLRGSSITGYFLVVALAGLLLSTWGVIIFGALSALAVVGFYYAEVSGAISLVLPPQVRFVDLAVLIMTVGLAAAVMHIAVRSISTGFEHARRNADALRASNIELQASRDALVQQTSELERRARYLEATVSVARDVATVQEPQMLLTNVVRLISEQFGFYHAGAFLLDSTGEWAILQAASSEGGQRMLARGHKLRVGQQGTVGYVTSRGKARITLDISEDAIFFNNPDLPETRSAVTLPLRVHDQIIGALDVQSKEPNAFGDEDAKVLQSLADQIALAMSNAQLFLQAQESIEAERLARGELSREMWARLLGGEGELGYLSTAQGISSTWDAWLPEMETAMQSAKTVVSEQDRTRLAIPLEVGGQVIGVLDGYKAQGWTVEEVAMTQTLVEQLNAAVERARLYRDTQRRAARERTVGEVTGRIRETLNVEAVLKTAADEIRQALQLERLVVRLGAPDEDTVQPTEKGYEDVEQD
ncbi:MAG: GAF domain-containing protein [Anaerolineae bacterium]|nr:GAF domain-containing protein [Anaerolineae bacterium]